METIQRSVFKYKRHSVYHRHMAARGQYAKGVAKREEISRRRLEVIARNGYRRTSVQGARRGGRTQPGRTAALLQLEGGALPGDPAQARRGRRGHDFLLGDGIGSSTVGLRRRWCAQHRGSRASCSSTPSCPRRPATPTIRPASTSSIASRASATASGRRSRAQQAAGRIRPDIDPDRRHQPHARGLRRDADPVDARSDDRHGRAHRVPSDALVRSSRAGTSMASDAAARRTASSAATCAATTSHSCSTRSARSGPERPQRDRRGDRAHPRRCHGARRQR